MLYLPPPTPSRRTTPEQAASLHAGHRVIYENEVPFELRVQQVANAPQEVGTLEAVRVKILLLGPDESPSAVRATPTQNTSCATANSL